MKCLGLNINWLNGWSTDPYINILVDHIPAREELRYERRGCDFFAELDGYVSFYWWKAPDNNGGYSGWTFPVTLIDGETVTLRGPWSSRPSAMLAAGFRPSVDVSITEDPQTLERGYTFSGGHTTVEWMEAALAEFKPGILLRTRESHGETVHCLSRDDMHLDPNNIGKIDPFKRANDSALFHLEGEGRR